MQPMMARCLAWYYIQATEFASNVMFLDRFKGVDIRFIEKLTRYAKVAVVISKADSLTDEEVRVLPERYVIGATVLHLT